MQDKFYAVIDTNVIVSALISKSFTSNPVKVLRAIFQERIVPLFNEEILAEYREVLSRPKFNHQALQGDYRWGQRGDRLGGGSGDARSLHQA
jgi:putative toxin-antitoxin system toxin component, PIN family